MSSFSQKPSRICTRGRTRKEWEWQCERKVMMIKVPSISQNAYQERPWMVRTNCSKKRHDRPLPTLFDNLLLATSGVRPTNTTNYHQTHQVTLGLGASDRRSICSCGTSCVASSVIVRVAVAAPAFVAPPLPLALPAAAAAAEAAGGCPADDAEARSVSDVTELCRPWPVLLLLPSMFAWFGLRKMKFAWTKATDRR